jgi:hypothetical protein
VHPTPIDPPEVTLRHVIVAAASGRPIDAYFVVLPGSAKPTHNVPVPMHAAQAIARSYLPGCLLFVK